ncbi:DMT family transporter [Hyphomicrobium sp. NDB2Meth4]|uniref:DMT family transporter n=1 Tax=Hyphomicrobium sp. NDB2Meth4 TaxID=1892846 RepID=UPI0009F836EE|nr:DMT family transporter [Hyphomicrobium sp. NDB2Meth4]
MDQRTGTEAAPREADGHVHPGAQAPRETLTPAADRLKAIGLMCIAVTLFSALDTSAKYLVTHAHLPAIEVVWARFLGQFTLMLTLLTAMPLSALLHTRKLKLELTRSFLMVSTTACNFIALRHLRLDQTVSVTFLAPLIVALLAGPFLGEWVGWRRLVAIFVGFIGVLIVVHPGFGALHPAFAVSFTGMLVYSFFMILTRYLAAYDKPITMLFYSILIGTFALAPFAIWQWVWPQNWSEWLLLSGLGVFGGVGHYLFIHAYRLAPASSVAPFLYVQLLTMVAFGFAVFSDMPDIYTLVGSAVIIGSGIYLLHRENKLRAEVAPTDPP